MDDRANVRRWIEWNLRNYVEFGLGLWALEMKTSGAFLGDCGLTYQDVEGVREWRSAITWFDVSAAKGYATEAARACLDVAFERTSGEQVCSIVSPANEASCRVAAVFPSKHQQPRSRGHMLVVPVIHVAQIYDLEGVLAGALMTTVARVARALKKACAAEGVSVRQNNETHGGQDVFHVHFHVIPRFEADGFNTGEARFPFGAVEVPLSERVKQAAVLRDALDLTRRPGPVTEAG